MQQLYIERCSTLDKLTCEDIKDYILDTEIDIENLRDYEQEYYEDLLNITIKYLQGRAKHRVIHSKR